MSLAAPPCPCGAVDANPRLNDLTSHWEAAPSRHLWNFFNLYNAKVLQVPDSEYPFRMWLFGWAVDDPAGNYDAIFHARSKDLASWEVYSGEAGWDAGMRPERWQPVLQRDATPHGNMAAGDPSVVYHQGQYFMAYSSVGIAEITEATGKSVCLKNSVMGAVSKDGIHWERSAAPLLAWEGEPTHPWRLTPQGTIGPQPEDYYGSYHRPSLLFDQGKWRIWFDYYHPGTFVSLGLAENSGDFLNPADWKIIRAGREPLIKDFPNPSVIRIGARCLAFSDAPNYPPEWGGDSRQMTVAESVNGIDWNILGHIRPEGLASSHVMEPFLLEKDGESWLYLFYGWKPERRKDQPWDYRYKEIRAIRQQISPSK